MKRFMQDCLKCHHAFSTQTLLSAKGDRMSLCGLHFAIVSDKLDLSSTERRLEKEKDNFHCVNKSVYVATTVCENCAFF